MKKLFTALALSLTVALSAQVSSSGISGSGTVNYLPKFSGSKKVTNSTITDNNGIVKFGSGSRVMTLDYSSGYTTLSFDEATPDLTNYSLLKSSGVTIVNGTDASPVSIRRNNSVIVNFHAPALNEPALDFNNTISNTTIRLYDHYGIGLGSNRLLINANIGGSVQIGTYDGTIVDATFIFNTVKGTVNCPKMPTSPAGLDVNDLWNDNGTIKIVQ